MRFFGLILLFFCKWSNHDAIFAQNSLNPKVDTLVFFGQISSWGHYNFNNAPHMQLGGRYIPSLNYSRKFNHNRKFDLEGSANMVGSLSTLPPDTFISDGTIQPYRLWARFSSSQFELRVGLQKINFGSASMLRPLMWFDQLDPRDPLKLTNGVWGALARYYFLNNSNLWLWCLFGNTKPRPWDIGETSKDKPEFGGRYQHAVKKGEIALSYHYREVDARNIGYTIQGYTNIPENRLGVDGRFDTKAGLWYEAVWIHKAKSMGILSNQEILNVGTDYTLGWGNGLNIVFEQLLFSGDSTPFEFKNKILFSGLSLNYPLGIADHIHAIFYYDWKTNNTYNFINWNHNLGNLSLFLMAYLNPDKYKLPQQGNIGNTYSGPGFQMMIVYHH